MITVVKPSFEILRGFTRNDLKLIEAAGRTCYKSEGCGTYGVMERFIRRLRESKHESVLEHVSATVRFICSRSCSHQLVRHRLGAYSQESQRYCNYGKKGFQFICPDGIGLNPGTYDNFFEPGITVQQRKWLEARYADCCEYIACLDTMKPEDARECLPNASKTEIVATYNARQWRHVFKERCGKHAQPQIRGLMQGVLREFNMAVPELFEDLIDE